MSKKLSHFYLTEKQRAFLKKQSEITGNSQASIVRYAINKLMEERKSGNDDSNFNDLDTSSVTLD
jgi:hypothetical protein